MQLLQCSLPALRTAHCNLYDVGTQNLPCPSFVPGTGEDFGLTMAWVTVFGGNPDPQNQEILVFRKHGATLDTTNSRHRGTFPATKHRISWVGGCIRSVFRSNEHFEMDVLLHLVLSIKTGVWKKEWIKSYKQLCIKPIGSMGPMVYLPTFSWILYLKCRNLYLYSSSHGSVFWETCFWETFWLQRQYCLVNRDPCNCWL